MNATQPASEEPILILGGGLMGLAIAHQLVWRGLERVPGWVAQIEADSGLACGLRTTCIVVPFRSEKARDHYPTAAFGAPLNRDQLLQELPGLGPDWRAGLLFAQDGQIDNRRQLMRALERACVELGVRFQEGVEVLELLREDQLQAVRTRNAEGRITT
jgi:glycine oxidase